MSYIPSLMKIGSDSKVNVRGVSQTAWSSHKPTVGKWAEIHVLSFGINI
jgi:hypothetical protein